MDKDRIQAYSYRITNAGRVELIVIMYEMALDYIDDAKLAADRDLSEYFRNLTLAKRVIDQLAADLDMQYEISGQLLASYLAMDRFFIGAMRRYDEEALKKLDCLEKMIGSLHDAFKKISHDDQEGPVMQNAQQVYAGLTYSRLGQNNENYSESDNRGFKA